jgi:hypothetical protein
MVVSRDRANVIDGAGDNQAPPRAQGPASHPSDAGAAAVPDPAMLDPTLLDPHDLR